MARNVPRDLRPWHVPIYDFIRRVFSDTTATPKISCAFPYFPWFAQIVWMNASPSPREGMAQPIVILVANITKSVDVPRRLMGSGGGDVAKLRGIPNDGSNGQAESAKSVDWLHGA